MATSTMDQIESETAYAVVVSGETRRGFFGSLEAAKAGAADAIDKRLKVHIESYAPHAPTHFWSYDPEANSWASSDFSPE